jgi:hypothetical protein
MRKSELENYGISLCAEMDSLDPHNNDVFPSWEEIRLMMEGNLDNKQEAILLERIKNSETSDPAGNALKGLLERNNYKTTALKKSNLRLRNKVTRAYKSGHNLFPLKRIAAIFILVSGLATVLYLMSSNTDFSKAYTRDPGFPVYLSSENYSPAWMEAYRADDLDRSLHIILQRSDFLFNDTLKYYAAVIYYEEKKYENALILLNSIADTTLIYKSIMLKSFSYYKLDKIDSARLQLLHLTQFNNPLGDDARSYLSEYFEK